MGGRATTDSLSRSGGGVGGDYRPGSSSGRKTQGDAGQASNAAHSPSGSPSAAGLSQDALLEQTSDPDDAYYRHGLAFGFALSRFRNFNHPISEAGANWRQPKTTTRSPAAKGCGKAASWKSPQNGLSHCAWKSAHTADSHFTHSLDYYWKIKNARPRQKRTFLMS